MTENTKQLESLSYTPITAPPTVKEISNPIIEPEIGVEKDKTRSQLPNNNAMIFEQIDGACNVVNELLAQLVPKTEDVDDCIITHKAWQNNNLKHLKGDFE